MTDWTDAMKGYAWGVRRFQTGTFAADEALLAAISTASGNPDALVVPHDGLRYVRASIPQGRDELRELRRSLPAAWRVAVDRALTGEAIPGFVVDLLVERLTADRPVDAAPTLLGVELSSHDEFAELARRLGVFALHLATAELDRRSRARLLRKLPDEGTYLRTLDEAPTPLVSVCQDAFVRLSEREPDVVDCSVRMGQLLIAFLLSDDDTTRVAGHLSGTDRNQWKELCATARGSSRRAAVRDAAPFLEEALGDG